MRNSFTAAAILVVTLVTSSVASGWKVAVDANLMLTQNAYSDNWIGEEAGAATWTFNSNSLAEKQLHAMVHNKNSLKLSFGQNYKQDEDTKAWSAPAKSTDLVDFESVFRATLGRFVDPFVAGRVETQFLDASDPEINRYLNPIQLTESFGVAKVLIKDEKRDWTARLGGGLRQRINRDVLVDSVASVREAEIDKDGGIEFVTDLKTPLAQERIIFTSKLSFFRTLFRSESEKFKGLPNESYWKSIDVNWENILTANITNYLMVNLHVQLLYDKEIDLGVRFKQTLSLGVTYRVL